MNIEKIKNFLVNKQDEPSKRKIENLVIFVIILIITVIIINVIWKDDSDEGKGQESEDKNKKLASLEENASSEVVSNGSYSKDEMIENLENILTKINGVGKVKVMITYSQTSQTIPLYNQDSTEKNTEETDKQGGSRKITETDIKKEIIYKEESGKKIPITQSIVSPSVEGAIIAAEGAGNATVKTNIIQAVEAVTGVATHKIQVFEMSGD